MLFLLTNDDGIEAPGLEALSQAVQPIGDAMVVAPHEHLSGCSHRVTTSQPFRWTKHRERRFAVEGTPADCIRVALHQKIFDHAWILAGINAGGNLGADVYHSGTVAAVREAALHGFPGIAVSHYLRRGVRADWQRAARWVTPIIRDLMTRPWKPGVFWNINLPHVDPDSTDPEVIDCQLDPQPLPISYRLDGDLFHYNGDYHQRDRVAGCDVDVCFRGKIAVTQLSLF